VTRVRAIAALAVCLAGAGTALSGPALAAEKAVPFMRGFTLADWGAGGYPPAATQRALKRLKRANVDAVTLLVVWRQQNVRSTEVAPADDITVPTRNLRSAIRSARRLGMRVILRPYIDPRDDWRGFIDPQAPQAWFDSYGRFVERFAGLARRERASGFVVGSELVRMSTYDDDWRALVTRVRQRFPGFLTYQANWDEPARGWWGALDAISLSAYYPLSDLSDPSVSQLREGWAGWTSRIEGYQRTYDVPVMFGEIGYRPLSGTTAKPWDVDFTAERNAALQRRAYQAALAHWYRTPWFRGAFWWYASPRPAELLRHRGGDHQPMRGAMAVVRRWYGRAR
jgi:hypothetical protein